MERQTLCRQRAHLTALAHRYPDLWKRVDLVRMERGKRFKDWPDWCFLPVAGAIEVVTGYGPRHDPMDYSRVAALSAWRVTQGVYRFDPDLYAELIETPLTGDIPHDILFRLPEWCVYVETPGMRFFRGRLLGFYAHLEYSVGDDRVDLRLLLDLDALDPVPLILHLGPWSLEESVLRMLGTARGMAHRVLGDASQISGPEWDRYALELAEQIRPMLSLLLYLCSVNADLPQEWAHRPPPTLKRHKGIARAYPPDAATVWPVGVRIGAALRAARAVREMEPPEDASPAGGGRARPRPHIRRAHWHGYWTGPKSQPSFTLKWLPPIPVAVTDVDALATVIRPVRG